MEGLEPSISEPPSEARLEQDGASTRSISTPPLKTPSVLDSAPPSFGTQSCGPPTTFVRQKNGWTAEGERRLKNSLLAGVGFLELGNAGDFAANVWNQVPVPHFAMGLMALGATLALTIAIFAVRDAFLSRENIRNLREERRFLWAQKADLGPEVSRALDSQLDINFRELGTEYVERLCMDIVMGFGTVMVGVGTFLAIGGANPRVYRASNLLSGYIGNAPVALYGLGNAAFSAYVWRRARRHSRAARKEMLSAMFRRRLRRVKNHAMINAIGGVTAGAASLVTATHWEGYPVLLPCIISSMACNYMWRKRIGYERPLTQQKVELDKASLIRELEHITSTRKIFKTVDPSQWFTEIIPNPDSLSSILEFFRTNDLFDDLCLRLLKDDSLTRSVLGGLGHEVMIDEQMVLAADKELYPRIIKTSEETLGKMGPLRFKYRERYCLETLGCYLCSAGPETVKEKC
ncbi:hypothetical protein N431DRAFT_496862 [Stipitochalara longipes BDJ]|nr:hypothetical protein N431DRAFT_496862 [Stipitochalara longipes BDJ]